MPPSLHPCSYISGDIGKQQRDVCRGKCFLTTGKQRNATLLAQKVPDNTKRTFRICLFVSLRRKGRSKRLSFQVRHIQQRGAFRRFLCRKSAVHVKTSFHSTENRESASIERVLPTRESRAIPSCRPGGFPVFFRFYPVHSPESRNGMFYKVVFFHLPSFPAAQTNAFLPLSE